MDTHTHFRPYLAEPRPCWQCHHFGALIYQGSAAWCRMPGASAVRAMPQAGCSAWEREVGADDEPDLVPAAAAGFGQSGSSLAIKGAIAG
jgi:hypothetical protein